MASQKISAMTAATTLDLTEVIPLVQSSANKKVTLANLFLLAPVIKRDDTSSAGSFTNAGTGANGGVIVCSTTGSLKGIEFHTSATGSGSGVRTRASSSGLLIDIRSNSATWSNAFCIDFNGNITSGNDTIGGALHLRGNFDNYVACYREGTQLWFSGTASNYGFSTDWVVYNTTTSNGVIRVDNATDVITFNGSVTFGDAKNVSLNTTTGTKWGTATGQKQAWWGANPVVQQVLATGAGATVDDVITKLQLIGLFKQS